MRVLAVAGLVIALLPATAQAQTQTREDPADAAGQADLRTVTWERGAGAATLKVRLTATAPRVVFGGHVLLDTDADGIADLEIAAARNPDGASVDVALRQLNRALSTTECQSLGGKALATKTLSTTIADNLESFEFAVDPALVPAVFRWVAFVQTPPDGAAAGPWDAMPDAASTGPNPGDRRCDAAKDGLILSMKDAFAFPDPVVATPTPTPTPAPIATAAAPKAPPPVVTLALKGGPPPAGTPATLDASGTIAAPGARIVAYEWDMNGDGHFDTNTGTNPIARFIPGSASQTARVRAIDSNYNSGAGSVVVTPTAAVRAHCETQASIGVLRIRAACIRHIGDIYIADPMVSSTTTHGWSEWAIAVNGLTLVTHDPGAQVKFDTGGTGHIIATGQWDVRILNTPGGDVTWYESPEDGFNWPLPTGVRGAPMHIVSVSAEEECVEHESTACAEVPGGFPVTGMIDLGIDPGTLDVTLDVNVAVRTSIIGVTGRVRLRANLLLGGLDLESIAFGIEDATLGPVQVHRLRFTYEPPGHGEPPHPGGLWDVAMDIELQSPPFEVEGQMRFVDGRFNFAGADVRFTPGIPIYASLFFNRFAASFGVDPIRVGGGIGGSFAGVFQINANWHYVAFADGRIGFRIDGIALLVGGELANFRMDVWNDGYIAYSGRLGYSYPAEAPGFTIFGQTDFWAEPDPGGGPARYQGDGDLTIGIAGFHASAHAFINNNYAAACFLGMKAVHDYRTGENTLLFAPSCDLGRYTLQPTRPHTGFTPDEGDASAAQSLAAPPARALTVARGQRALTLQVAGEGGAPILTLTDPTGKVYTPTSTPAKVSTAGNFMSAYVPEGKVTLLRIDKPLAGEWTLTPQPGSPAIGKVLTAEELPPLKVRASVSGAGRTRVLKWSAPGLAGRSIRFTERGANVGRTIAVTTKERGSVRYTIQDGSAGRRSVEAQVTAGGVPVEQPVVARYRAPGPPRPGRPGTLTARRRGETVTVRWPRLKGAKGYRVGVTGRDGRKELHFVTAKQRSVQIRIVAPTTALRVTVAGWITAPSITGRPRSATVRGVGGA